MIFFASKLDTRCRK